MTKVDYLIFGSNGFLGSQILQQLKFNSYVAVGVRRENPRRNIYLGEVFSNYSLNELISLISLHQPKQILISIGLSSISQTEKSPNLIKGTEENLRNLMDAINICVPESRVFFISSAAVYGNSSNNALSENNSLRPTSKYGVHKLALESTVQKLAWKNKIDLSILRIFSVYGPSQKKHVVWDTYNKIQSENQVKLHGTGDEKRDFIFIDELTNQIINLTELKSNLPDVINLGTGYPLTIKELSTKILTICDSPLKVFFSGVNDTRNPFCLYPDLSKARNLGLIKSTPNSLDKGLIATISSWKENENTVNS